MHSSERIRDYLKSQAPFSVIDRGIALAENDHILECSKSGNRVVGSIREDDDSYSVYLDIISSNKVAAGCSCCSQEDMQEQWCQHAVGLLWRAAELDFFTPSSGFVETESTYRMNTSSPADIAVVFNEVSQVEAIVNAGKEYRPAVSIYLDISGDRLGVQVAFDAQVQTPSLFDGFEHRSSRSMDNILLQILDDEGSWDEGSGMWFINSSRSIEIIIGLLQEYPSVLAVKTNQPIVFAKELLQAKVTIEWLDTAAELVLYWVTANGEAHLKAGEILGTGPYWTCIEEVIYKLSPSASRLASIFPYSSTITISKAQMGPILEVINEGLYDPFIVDIRNPDAQPESVVKEPRPILDLEKRENPGESYLGNDNLEIVGLLEFEYPTPAEDENIVYLPHRELERQYSEELARLGFEYSNTKKRYVINADAALDLIHDYENIFSAEWEVTGLESIAKSIKFAELQLNVDVAARPTTKAKKSQSIDWFDCQISLIQNSANVPLSLLFKNLRSDTDRWIRLDSGAFAKVPGGGMHQLRTTLGMIDPNFKLSNTIKTKLNVAQAVSITRIEDSQFNISLDKNLKAIAKKLLNFENITRITPTKNFTGSLRPYQLEGLSWLHFLYEYNFHGILADEMGLGKTVQTIALLQHIAETQAAGEGKSSRKKNLPNLIIAPTSVITNWLYECRRFAPKLSVLLLHGSGRKAHYHEIPDHDIVITSYALLRLDRYELEKHHYGHFILDEAQNIKNPQAATTKAAKAMHAEHRLALSGTPTENRPMELWSIMDFLMPGYLGSQDFFRNQIERPIIESGAGVVQGAYLNSKTRPFILRRLKSNVEKDLPPKTESVLYTPMADSQQELYQQILDEVRPRVFNAIEEKGIRGASISILAALLRLRQVCNHPNSIESLKSAPGYESGKFEALKDLVVEALENGRKILVFSQFREMLYLIRSWLEEQQFSFLYLDGSTKNRQDLVEQFNADPAVRLFLISLKAGGTGLNLTAADTVIIYDPWWNPAVEGQAVDRAHRIGQTKAVSVYRLVTENSIEQKIMDLKRKKAALIDALINENGLSTLKLSKADLESFFSPLPSD